MIKVIFIVLIVVLIIAKWIFRVQNREHLESIKWLDRMRDRFNPKDSSMMDVTCSSRAIKRGVPIFKRPGALRKEDEKHWSENQSRRIVKWRLK